MLVVRATKKLLDRLGPVTLESGQTSTTRLGDWYTSAWAWRPQVALFVSEATLFPILMPLAPAATLLARFPDRLAQALAAHDVPEAFITEELSRMQDVRLGKTASRSMLGIMNEFTFLAQTMRGDATTDLARWLARTPCSPLFKRHRSPDLELRALIPAAYLNACQSGAFRLRERGRAVQTGTQRRRYGAGHREYCRSSEQGSSQVVGFLVLSEPE